MIAEGLLALVAERLAVLGQVVRLRLIEQLADGAATPQELAETLGLTQQNVSKHLQDPVPSRGRQRVFADLAA